MAFSSAPTLCEVTYDITDEEKRYTPFRYQCRSAQVTRTNAHSPTGYSEVTNFSLPTGLTVTYYEYLRSLYDSRIQSAHHKRAYRHSSAHPSTGSHVTDAASRRPGRPKTALPYVSFPYPTALQSPGGKEDVDDGVERYPEDKLVWVDALNKWVPENQLNSRPYVSFVGTAPTVEKLYSSLKEQQKLEGFDTLACDRYDEHMKLYEHKAKHGIAPKQLQPEHSFIRRLMALKKKEALRKKAFEQLEERRLRKSQIASQQPPANNDKRQKVRFDMPMATKMSPRSPRDSAVKQEQDYDKSLEDKANTEDIKNKPFVMPEQEVDVRESSSSETDSEKLRRKEQEEAEKRKKLLEKSLSEIEREKAKELLAEAAKRKKEKQENVRVDKPDPPKVKIEPSTLKTDLPKVKIEPSIPRPEENQEETKSLPTLPPMVPPEPNDPKEPHTLSKSKGESKKTKKGGSKKDKEIKTKDVKPVRTKPRSLTKVKSSSSKDYIPDQVVIPMHTVDSDASFNNVKYSKLPPITHTKKDNSNYVTSDWKMESKLNQVTMNKKEADLMTKSEDKVEKSSKTICNEERISEDVEKIVPINIKMDSPEVLTVTETPTEVVTNPPHKSILQKPLKSHKLNKPIKTPIKNIKIVNKEPSIEEPVVKIKKKVRIVDPSESVTTVDISMGRVNIDIPVAPVQLEAEKPSVRSTPRLVRQEGLDIEETGTLISEDTTHSLSTIEDTKTGPLSLTVSENKSPEPEDIAQNQARRRSVVKKAFIPRVKPRTERQDSTPTPEPREDTPPTPVQEEEEKVQEVQESKEPALPIVELDEPPLPDPTIHKCKDTKSTSNNKSVIKPLVKLENKLKKQRQFKRDTSYEDELRRQEEAERRRQRQMEMLEKLKNKNKKSVGEVESEEEARKFENYGFLAKYCIFNRLSLEAYRRTFESVDDEKKGFIQGLEVMIALRGINQNISYNEEEYLYRVMDIAGYNISKGADFKLFAVMAALSLKISSLDSWMKNMIGSMDFKMLDTKMYMCKKLWECNVDPDTNTISLDQLCIELRAGGISPEHELEVREKLSHLKSLDLLDFLTYIPLFIMIHESVVDNPFDERRDK